MNIALWVVQGLLAGAFLIAGFSKVARDRERLVEQMDWVEDFSGPTVRSIGILEMLAGVGLILPPIVGVAGVLVPWAAVGLALIQIGAMFVHIRRAEYPFLAVNLTFVAMAVFVAWGRFGDYSF